VSCPKNGDVPKSPLPPIGSPAAIGKHDFNFSNRHWFMSGAVGTSLLVTPAKKWRMHMTSFIPALLIFAGIISFGAAGS
jgi:hypothetical protein